MAKSTVKGASTHSLQFADQLQSLARHHHETCLKTLSNLLVSWPTSLMTWLVIGIALALPAILYLLLVNATNLGGEFDGTARINLYLDGGANPSAIQSQVRELQDVETTRYISAEEALQGFESDTGFGNILQSLPNNPLPDVIEVLPRALDPVALRLLATRLEGLGGVERVAIDLEWIERLFALLALGERFVATLGVFLCLGVVLAIGNTIRLAIENRRSEIEIVKLVGATDAFVRRPFLYLGFWYGVGGALVAWMLVQSSLLVLSGPIENLLNSYQNQFALAGMGVGTTISLFTIGVLLGVLGAAIAVSRHLHTIEPT